jgi:membrane fusion protein, copper/silver efflux system
MNMNKLRKSVFWFAVIIIAGLALLTLSSCTKYAAESKPADVDYYTCAMHPSVRSQDPKGKCPICGMDLIPVKKKSSSETNMTGMPGMSGMSGMSGEQEKQHHEGASSSEFTVPAERQQQIGVIYATVEKRPLRLELRVAGLVAPDKKREWEYTPRVEGYIQKLFAFSPGEIIESNSPILTIYSPDLFTAQKEFVNVLQMRDRAQSNNNADVLNSSRELVTAAEDRLRLWNVPNDQIAQIENDRKPHEYLTLNSPFKGMVENIGVEQGVRIMAGERVVKIVDLSVVWVWAQFYQEDLPLLNKDDSISITTSSYPDEKFDGKIAVTDPSLNEATRTIRVRIDVQNPDFKLRPDMYVDVSLAKDIGEGLAVPVRAILPTGLHNVAFVDKGNGKLEPRFVELGREYGDFYQVKCGLKEDERVVASANFLIDAEAQVQGALKLW